MSNEAKFSLKGWFGICPVYVADLDGEAPLIAARHWSLNPLFWISEAIIGMANMMNSALFDDYEPVFPIRITGSIDS